MSPPCATSANLALSSPNFCAACSKSLHFSQIAGRAADFSVVSPLPLPLRKEALQIGVQKLALLGQRPGVRGDIVGKRHVTLYDLGDHADMGAVGVHEGLAILDDVGGLVGGEGGRGAEPGGEREAGGRDPAGEAEHEWILPW